MQVECVVVGAGVVGVAVARALAQAGHEVVLLESAERPGEGISSRNSGVIHAGMYYPPGSLKARCCVRGLELMYEFCARRHVAHRRLGKLIVACDEQELPALRAIADRAALNGVEVRWLEAAEAIACEPELRCVAALDSPASGIVDVPELITALLGEMEQAGGMLVCRTTVGAIRALSSGFELEIGDDQRIQSRLLINAAGLDAPAVASRIDQMPPHCVPSLWFGQGHYYRLRGRVPFQRLIYPVPGPYGLGVHLGLDLGGQARFGPDVRWIDAPDYDFDDSQRQAFAESIQRWWPRLLEQDLLPDFVGVRPKLSGPGEPGVDFKIQTEVEHGLPGLINLFGIESPGLTSSMALAEHLLAGLQA